MNVYAFLRSIMRYEIVLRPPPYPIYDEIDVSKMLVKQSLIINSNINNNCTTFMEPRLGAGQGTEDPTKT